MLMFSATWPETIHQLAEEFLGDYQTIEVGGKNRNIEQRITVVDEVNRDYEFMEIIRGREFTEIIKGREFTEIIKGREYTEII